MTTTTNATAPPAAGSALAAHGAASPLRLPAELRPHAHLLRYYVLQSLLAGPAFFVLAGVLYFKYRSLRYALDGEGITMRWGILFRREISLTYARIQDIHVTSNVVERWLGLAKIQVQTASGSAAAEMTIEGIREVDALRDFLYSRMRGAQDAGASAAGALAAAEPPADGELYELAATLREIAAEVRALRAAREAE
jgi:putative membrane protein